MKLYIQVDTEPDGAISESVSFEGDVTDLAAAACVLLENAGERVAFLAARFAEKSLTALTMGDDEEAAPQGDGLSGSAV